VLATAAFVGLTILPSMLLWYRLRHGVKPEPMPYWYQGDIDNPEAT
jgi:hypothetical protein